MDARTRVKTCKLIEKLDKHPELAETLGIQRSSTIKTNRTKKKEVKR